MCPWARQRESVLWEVASTEPAVSPGLVDCQALINILGRRKWYFWWFGEDTLITLRAHHGSLGSCEYRTCCEPRSSELSGALNYPWKEETLFLMIWRRYFDHFTCISIQAYWLRCYADLWDRPSILATGAQLRIGCKTACTPIESEI